jgi:transcriptional regulator with GAF, ATPase, and Fis domain
VEVPPLRERRSDIPALAAHFINRLSRQYGRRVERISDRMMQHMISYDWPGNIREMENVLSRALVLTRSSVLEMPVHDASLTGTPAARPMVSLAESERQHIESVLAAANWVVEGPQGAAQILKLHPSTLRSRMKKLGIRRHD